MQPAPRHALVPARRRAQRLPHAACAAGIAALAQAAAAQPLPLQSVPALRPAPAGEAAQREAPLYLRADRLSGQAETELVASGNVELRHAGVVLRADELRYDQAEDLAVAQGKVHISFQGSVIRAPRAQLQVQRFAGFALLPDYDLALTGAGGRAERVDILDRGHARVTQGNYTSCPRDGTAEPDWLLSADRLDLDLEAGVGVAEGAQLRFLGVPIVALPSLSFPLSDQRKSGWLPPSLDVTTGSGFEVTAPYYWNIAPNRDATIAPGLSTRRGFSLAGEFRYLEPDFAGTATLNLLPYDHVADRTRYWFTLGHEGQAPAGMQYSVLAERVSDDLWWNDFPRRHHALTPRLLPLVAQIEREFGDAERGLQLYARTQRWQPLQYPNAMNAPFDRSLQLGLRSSGALPAGAQYALEAEANRFDLPSNPGYTPTTMPSDGSRLHAQGWVSRPWREPGWWLTPGVLFNAAYYATDQPMPDGRSAAGRVIPTYSVGGGMEFERPAGWSGRALRQTLEPRLLYVYTPYVRQADYPNFDAAIKDYSFATIFSENAFSGIDRVSDTNALTAGVTTRLLDAATGAELLQFGLVQRYLFSEQLITDTGLPERKGYSDLLVRGSTRVIPAWDLQGYLRYSPNIDRTVRAILGVQYAPGPFRTVNLTYRYARDLTSQYEVAWQWPIYGPTPDMRAARASEGTSCTRSWYTVGRVNYSTRDDRVTDSIIGVEYDAGCWIARLAVSRWSTGVSQASTQVLFQLELAGLSRLGTNALGILRENVPGYRLLRDGRSATPASAFYD